MTVYTETFRNADGWEANIGYHKFDINPHLDIYESVSDNCFVTRFTRYYDSEAKARKALNAYAKRHELSKFERV